MYLDCVDAYLNGVIPSFESFLESSFRNDAQFELTGPARSAIDHVHHFRQELEPLYSNGSMSAKEVGRHVKDYALLNRIANLIKHNSATSSDTFINSRAQIAPALVANIFPLQNGGYMYLHMRVMVKLNSGEYRDLLDILINVVNAWGSFMVSNNLLPLEKAKQYRYTGDDYVTKEYAEDFPKPRIYQVPGERFSLAMIGRGYDYVTKSFYEVPFE